MKELTRKFPLSKTLALVVFTCLPIVSFVLGVKYQAAINSTNYTPPVYSYPSPTPRIFVGNAYNYCRSDDDCILVNKDSDFGCNVSEICQQVDYSLDKWIGVNITWTQKYIDTKCPQVRMMGMPACEPRPLNDQYTARCVSNRCEKLPLAR